MTKYYVGHGDLVINASWSPTLKGMAFYTTWAEKKQDIVKTEAEPNIEKKIGITISINRISMNNSSFN